MGFPIAYGLYRSGCPMVLPVYRDCTRRGYSPIAPDGEVKKERLEEMLAGGSEHASSQQELIVSSSLLMLSLPTSRQVEEVVLGEDGIAKHGRPGLVVVDLTSADPESTRRLSAVLEKRGIGYLDAPVSGGPGGASAQTLILPRTCFICDDRMVKQIFNDRQMQGTLFYLDIASITDSFLIRLLGSKPLFQVVFISFKTSNPFWVWAWTSDFGK